MRQDAEQAAQAVARAVGFWEGVLSESARALVAAYLSALEPSLLANLSPCGLLAEPARHMIAAGGRRIRSLVLLGACEALGGDWRQAVQQAVAVEFIHTASLIHDDIIDRSDTRRGVPAVHARAGMRTALLTGDVLCFVAIELCGDVKGASGVLAQACHEMCIGEALGEGPEAAEKKTASLFRAAAEIGGLMGGASGPCMDGLRSYGRMLGMAYQLRDDQLDGEGDADPAPYSERACAALDAVPLCAARELLRELVEFAAQRTR